MSTRRLAAIASAVCAVFAERFQSSDLAAEGEEGITFVDNANMICGTPEIWNEITKGGSSAAFESGMNINWELVETLKNKSLEVHKTQAGLCEAALKELTLALDARMKDQLPSTTQQHITDLLEAGLGDASFKGSAPAREFKCGKIRHLTKSGSRVRLPRKAYRKSVEAFESASKAFFSKKEFRLDGDLLQKVCNDMLVAGDTQDKTYCLNLCQEFRDLAQSHSNDMVGETAGSADKLKAEINKKDECVKKHRGSAQQCETDWQSLVPFRDQLAEMKATYGDRHKIMRSAEEALFDAMSQFEDLQDSLASAQKQLEEASSLLTAAGEGTSDAKAALAAAAGKENDLKGKVEGADSELAKLSVQLKDAQTADDLIGKLKDYVTQVMLMMERFSEAALREPIRNLGFPEYIEDFGFQDAGSVPAANVTREQVSSLHEYCAKTAMPAFDAVKELVDLDLSPLCSFRDVDAVSKDLVDQVKVAAESIKSDLAKVVSWLSPYRAQQKFTAAERKEAQAREDKLVSEGQLANLEKVKSVYFGKSPFFSYLMGWKKDGPHHQLIAKLKTLIDSLTAKVADVNKQLEALKADYAATQSAHEEAVSKLKEAVAQQNAAAEEKKRLEAVVAELEAKGKKMKSDVSDLESRVAKAKQEVDTAMTALAGAYTEATSASLVELEAERTQALQRVLRIEHSIALNDELCERAKTKVARVQRHGVA